MVKSVCAQSKDLVQLTSSGFSALLSAAVDGIIIIDRNGKICSFNSAAEKMFGFKSAEVLGNNINMLMPAPYRKEHDGYIETFNKHKIPKIIGIGRKVEAQRKDSSIFPVDLSVGEYSEEGEQFFVGIIRDLTEQVKAEREAIQIRQRLAHMDRVNIMGEMASGIAHELNQPLTAISSYVQACRRRIDTGNIDQEKLRELIIKTDAQAQRAGEIIRRIRALVRSHDMVREEIDINKLVLETVNFARADANRRGVSLHTELKCKFRYVIADSVQIQQVILNLILNAIDATEEARVKNPKIEIKTEKLENQNFAKITILDYGVGIPESIRDKMFETFVTTKTRGTGMGLSISRSIIDSHGGEIGARSMTEGTEFCFTLPGATMNRDH